MSELGQQATDPYVKRWWQLANSKQSNLCLSADVDQAETLLTLVEQVADQVICVKTHIDIIRDFTPALTQALRALADKHHFMLFEDRKFADIGNTVKQQCSGGVYQIASWADLVNAHIIPGPGIIEGLREALPPTSGLLLLAELSSKGHFCHADYQAHNLALALRYPEIVKGFICQHRLTDNPNLLHFTPGVHLASAGDPLGQQYRSPTQAIAEDGADFIIVGRGITQASDPKVAAENYRKAGWMAALERRERHG